jgi:hypothetical protein
VTPHSRMFAIDKGELVEILLAIARSAKAEPAGRVEALPILLREHDCLAVEAKTRRGGQAGFPVGPQNPASGLPYRRNRYAMGHGFSPSPSTCSALNRARSS